MNLQHGPLQMRESVFIKSEEDTFRNVLLVKLTNKDDGTGVSDGLHATGRLRFILYFKPRKRQTTFTHYIPNICRGRSSIDISLWERQYLYSLQSVKTRLVIFHSDIHMNGLVENAPAMNEHTKCILNIDSNLRLKRIEWIIGSSSYIPPRCTHIRSLHIRIITKQAEACT